jgi:flagellar motility protein MotE (MotC chaperone)
MTEQTDYNSMPLSELEKMVAGIPTSQMDTENPQPEEPKEEPKEETPEAQPEAPKEEEQKPEEKGEPEKKTPESIKKLLHQRSELRQDNDRLKTELEEAKEQLRKLRS